MYSGKSGYSFDLKQSVFDGAIDVVIGTVFGTLTSFLMPILKNEKDVVLALKNTAQNLISEIGSTVFELNVSMIRKVNLEKTIKSFVQWIYTVFVPKIANWSERRPPIFV